MASSYDPEAYRAKRDANYGSYAPRARRKAQWKWRYRGNKLTAMIARTEEKLEVLRELEAER